MAGITMAGGITLIDEKHPEFKEEKGAANGYAPLGADTKIPEAYMPASVSGYVHPVAHPATMITEDATHRFTTDAEKAGWAGKEPAITKNTAFNKNYGTVATDVKMNGTQAVGSVDAIARVDHVHPVDTSRAASYHTHTKANITDFTHTHVKADVTDFAHAHVMSDVTGLDTALQGKVDGTRVLTDVPAGAVFTDTVYVHPTTDGSLHVPATGTTNSGKYLKAGATAGVFSWADFAADGRAIVLTGLSTATNAAITAADTILSSLGKLQKQITDHIADAVKHITATERTNWGTAYTNNHTHGNKTVLDATTASFLIADETKLDGIATGANLYVHPNHTGAVTSTADGATVITANAVTNAMLADVATSTIKGRVTAATGDPEDLTVAQVKTLLSISNVDNTTDAGKPVSTAQATAIALKTDNTEVDALLQGNRNINLTNGGELRWGVVANTFSWSKAMSIYPAGGKLLRGGVAITSINIAIGTAVLAAAGDCMYITIPTTNGATAAVAVAQYNAITGNDKLIIAIRDTDSCLELLGGGWLVYGSTVAAGGARDNYINKSIVTAANDFIVGTASNAVAKKTLAETKTILGISNVTNESKATMFTSAALTGTPTAPTATVGTNTTQVATTAFVLANATAGSSSVKKATAVYSDNDSAQTFTDAFCTIDSTVIIEITAGTPVGVWGVDSAAGSFTITSTATESADISLNYTIVKPN